jgi:uncharacterized protein
MFINNNLNRISHEYIKLDGNGEREMPTIVHFEIPSDDIERANKFYNGLFGWKIEKFPGMTPIGEYRTVTTTDDKGNKAIGGGMMNRMYPEQQIRNYIGVKSVDEYSSKVEKMGGKVVAPKHAVPGMGYLAICLDTENNSFAIWESNESAE